MNSDVEVAYNDIAVVVRNISADWPRARRSALLKIRLLEIHQGHSSNLRRSVGSV